jgi:choline dehydrogenase-like flavoprotein
METFDAIVIGGGQSGPFLAAKLADAGRTVALIERRRLGAPASMTVASRPRH